MRASGNGDVAVCVHNLLRMVRGENPYERTKGLDPRLIDRPVEEAEVAQDAEWCIENYEPRATLESVTVEDGGSSGGGFHVSAKIKET